MINQTILRLARILIVLGTLTGVDGTGSLTTVIDIGSTGSMSNVESSELNDFKEGLIQALTREYPCIAKPKFGEYTPLVKTVMRFVPDTELNAFQCHIINYLKDRDVCITKTVKSVKRTLNGCTSVADLVNKSGTSQPLPGSVSVVDLISSFINVLDARLPPSVRRGICLRMIHTHLARRWDDIPEDRRIRVLEFINRVRQPL